MRGLIGDTWGLLRSHGSTMLLVGLVFLVPAELAVAHVREDDDTFGIAAYAALTLIGYAWVYGALVATIAHRVRSPLEPYGRTVDRLPTLVAYNFVAGFATTLALLLLIVPGLLLRPSRTPRGWSVWATRCSAPVSTRRSLRSATPSSGRRERCR